MAIPKHDIFISYSKPDLPLANTFALILNNAGYKVWFDEWSLVPGMPWKKVLSNAIRESRAILVCLGSSGMEKRQEEEIKSAIKLIEMGERTIFIPVLLPGANAGFYPKFVWNFDAIDFRKGLNNPRSLFLLTDFLDKERMNRAIASESKMEVDPKILSVPGKLGKLFMKSSRPYLSALGKKSQQTTSTYKIQSLSGLIRDSDDLNKAEDFFKRELISAEEKLGPEHSTVAKNLNNFGGVLRLRGRLEDAQNCFERALKIHKELLGGEHPTVAVRLNNLGSVYHDRKDLDRARACFEQALTIDEKALGGKHPAVANRLNNLGSVYHEQNKLDFAEACFVQALSIYREASGNNHAVIATCLNNLGSVYHDRKDLDRARACFEQALEIDEMVLGDNHPTVAIHLNNFGSVLYDLGDFEEAGKCFWRVFRIYKEAGLGHEGFYEQTLVNSINNLGVVLKNQGELESSIKIFEEPVAQTHARTIC